MVEYKEGVSNPISRYEYVQVVFPTAGVDVAISHTLAPTNADLVDYEVVQRDRPGHIYQDDTATRRAWSTNEIYLRSDTAGMKATLRLSLAQIAVARDAKTLPYAGASSVVSDAVYGVGWDGVTTIAPSKNAVYDKIEALAATIPATAQITAVTGNQNNFNLTARHVVLFATGAAPVFTGFTVLGAAPVSGDRVRIYAQGTSAKVTNEDAASTAANRITSPSTAGQIIGAGGAMELVYDAANSRWRETLLDPGAHLTVAHVGGDYTASGAMTWTVDAGDLTVYTYRQWGKSLELSITISTSTTGGVASSGLRAALPGFTSAAGNRFAIAYGFNGGANIAVYTQANATTYIEFRRLDAANWTLEANLVYVGFQGFLPIQ